MILLSIVNRVNEKRNFNQKEELQTKAQEGTLNNEEYSDEINNFKNDNTIEINSFEMLDIDDETMATTYFNRYKNELLENPEKAYKELDEEYRDKRFGNYENYKKYIEDNFEYICNMNLKEFSINNTTDYTEYICKNQYDGCYIFKETTVMQYTVELDDYTIDRPEFVKIYEESNEKKKVMLNIDRFVQMVNSHDYSQIYKILDESFKENNFKNESEFISYMEETFFDENKIKYTNFNEVGDIYTCDIEITDAKNQTEQKRKKTIIMKLLEGTKFVMSFNVK